MQPNVNNEEMQVTRKLRCYPAYEMIKKDTQTTGISISIREIVARSAGLPAEIFLAIIVVCTVAGLYIA